MNYIKLESADSPVSHLFNRSFNLQIEKNFNDVEF